MAGDDQNPGKPTPRSVAKKEDDNKRTPQRRWPMPQNGQGAGNAGFSQQNQPPVRPPSRPFTFPSLQAPSSSAFGNHVPNGSGGGQAGQFPSGVGGAGGIPQAPAPRMGTGIPRLDLPPMPPQLFSNLSAIYNMSPQNFARDPRLSQFPQRDDAADATDLGTSDQNHSYGLPRLPLGGQGTTSGESNSAPGSQSDQAKTASNKRDAATADLDFLELIKRLKTNSQDLVQARPNPTDYRPNMIVIPIIVGSGPSAIAGNPQQEGDSVISNNFPTVNVSYYLEGDLSITIGPNPNGNESDQRQQPSAEEGEENDEDETLNGQEQP